MHGGLYNSPTTAVAPLHTALTDAHQVAVSTWSPEARIDWLAELHRARASLEALIVTATAAARRNGVAKAVGHAKISGAVAAASSVDPGVVGRDQGLGRWLEHVPLIAEAFARGEITRRHVDVYRSADNPRTHQRLIDHQELLLAAATHDFKQFTVIVEYWKNAADPDGAEPDAQVTARFFTITKRPDGTVTGSFQFDPLVGDAVMTAIAREEQRLYDADTNAGVERTIRQRRADAVANLITRGTTRADGTYPAPLFHLNLGWELYEQLLTDLANTLTNDADHDDDDEEPEIAAAEPTLEDTLDALADTYREPPPKTGTPLPADHDRPEQWCELVDGTPIHPTLARAWLPFADLRRLVITIDGEILDLGRKVRGFPTHLKQALLAAARGRCGVPSCDAPITWLQADHIQPWRHHGPTAIRNGQILCATHNRIKRDTVTPESDERAPP